MKNKKKFWMIFGIVLLVIIIAAIVVGVVVSEKKKELTPEDYEAVCMYYQTEATKCAFDVAAMKLTTMEDMAEAMQTCLKKIYSQVEKDYGIKENEILPMLTNQCLEIVKQDPQAYLEEIRNSIPEQEENNSVPITTIPEIEKCEVEVEYENTMVDPIDCVCPEGYTFETVSMDWGPCAEEGMHDCIATVLKCVETDNDFCGTSLESYCESDGDCVTHGCNSEICGNTEDEISSICQAKECYDDEKYGVSCGCVDNKCVWN